jgi:hypothetical protein
VHSRNKWGRRGRQPWGRASRTVHVTGEARTEDHWGDDDWEREERGSKERRKKKKGSTEPVYGRRPPASLAPYCVTRSPVRLAPFLPTWRAPEPAGTIGRHRPWCDTPSITVAGTVFKH